VALTVSRNWFVCCFFR